MSTLGKIIASVAFFILLMALGYAAARNDGAAEYERMRANAQGLADQNDTLRNQNRHLEQQILGLREDGRLLERQARSDLELIRRDEILVVLSPQR